MMKRILKRRGDRGMTLVEVLMASGIFAIVSTALIMALNQFFRAQRRIRAMTTEDRMITSLVNNLRSNIHLYQNSFMPADAVDANNNLITDNMLKVLPIAFSDTIFLPAAQCPACPGRLGFVAQPVPGMPALYKITLRVQHELIYGKGATREFRFVASFK